MFLNLNIVATGATRRGKTLAAARSVVDSQDEAATVIFDPHKASLAETVLTHATGNILYQRLSDIQHTLGFEMLKPSPSGDAVENHRRGEGFTEILLRRRDSESMANTPLLEEWVMALMTLFLHQK